MPDYMVDPQERGFGPPNMAAQLFGMISGVGDAYQQGVKQKFERGQMARTEELQKPILGPDGQPSADYSTILREYLKRSGAEGAAGQLPTLWKQQFLEGEPGGGASPYGPPGGQTSGASVHGQQPELLHAAAGTQPGQPELSSAGTDDKGNDTVRGLATERGINVDSPGFKAAFGGVGLDRELNPAQAAAIVKRFALLTKGNAASDAPQPDAPDAAPPSTADRLRSLGMSRLTEPGAAPPAPAGQPQMAQAGTPSGAAGMVPPGADPRSYAQGLKQAAERERTAARREGIAGIPSKAREDKAAAYDKTADDILKAIAEEGKQRTQQGLDIAKTNAEKDREVARKRAEETMTQVDSANAKAIEGSERTRMMHSLTNQPDFNAGVGAHYIDILNGIGNRLFGLPNLGTSGQFFDKLRAGSILNEIKGLGGSGAGPVRVAEMKFINTMQASRDMNPTSVRSALVTEDRLHQRAQEIFDMKKDYLKTHTELDQGFTDKMADYAQKHHLFSDQEMAHPDLVGMPILTSETQLNAAQLPPGTPYRTGYGPDSKITFAPKPNVVAAPAGDRS